jgi:Na+-driven multidrug efflux pump
MKYYNLYFLLTGEFMDILYRIKNISQDKAFLRKIVAITIPIALQNFLNTTLNFIDTLMIGTPW